MAQKQKGVTEAMIEASKTFSTDARLAHREVA
jgi:hypothetical protein